MRIIEKEVRNIERLINEEAIEKYDETYGWITLHNQQQYRLELDSWYSIKTKMEQLGERTLPKDRLAIDDLEGSGAIKPLNQYAKAKEEIQVIDIGNFSTISG